MDNTPTSPTNGKNKVTPILERISPRIIPGALTNHNKGAIDWGWQSFLAYGCHRHVVVMDMKYLKIFQTLVKHKSDVVKVKWSKECHYHDSFNPYNLVLASSDNSGTIVVWDVKQGVEKSVLSDGNKTVADMDWVTGSDCCHHLLVALHPPYSVIVWNTETGSKVWKKLYTEVLQSFAFDPFSENNMAFLASDCILFVDDFNLTKVPSSNGRKFFVSNPSSTLGSQQSLNTIPSGHQSSAEEKSKSVSRSILPRRMRFLIRAETRNSLDEGVTLNECLQLIYHRSYRHHLLLLYPREILILDLEINQTVGIVAVDWSSPMTQLYSCAQRDVLFSLHESGSIGVRVRHRGNLSSNSPDTGDSSSICSNEMYLEVSYDTRCQSDPLRLTKHARIVGMSVCPVTECSAALLVSDGRIVLLELHATKQPTGSNSGIMSPLFTPGLSESLETFELPSCEGIENVTSIPFPSKMPYPRTTLADKIGSANYPIENFKKNSSGITLKMLLTGIFGGLAPMPHVIRMCPPVTFRNWAAYHPLLAVGNSNGSVQVFNMATGMNEREFSLHTAPVRGIEWVSLTSFLSYAHPNLCNNVGQVRNELVFTDFLSGRTLALRSDRNEESPIEMLRVSYLRQYFIVVFKEEPFELWDINTLTLLRTMPKNFPIITALSWSPLHKKPDKGKETDASDSVTSFPDTPQSPKSALPIKEHIVFTDTNGQLYHFTIEGNIVRDGSRIPPDAGMGSITAIVWKADKIVLSDVDGNLNLWDIKCKISSRIPTHRGWIKKIQFGPGRGNMKILLLYNDGVDLWNVDDATLISQIKCPHDMPKIQDIDWASSDRPVLATSDGCICITDINLKQVTSSIIDYHPTDFPFSPQILSSKAALNLKCMLQHQPWKCCYSIKFNSSDGFNSDDMFLLEKIIESVDEDVKNYLQDCQYGVAERCLHVSRLYGDEDGCKFWTVALHYLKSKIHKNTEEKSPPEDKDSSMITGQFADQPLDTSYDILCDSQNFRKLQLDRVLLHDVKRSTYAQTQKCAETLVFLGQTERAVQLLLESEADNDGFYVDWLRACLIATIQSSGASQSVIKLVATNLIASGRIPEGVQLLCLIDKALDGCRYLQSAGRWDQAVWLAKATLSQQECLEVLKRWIDHLCSPQVNQRGKAVMVLISLGQFWKAIEMLHSFKMTERAALLLQACLEFGIISKNESTSPTIDAIYLDYARYLLSIGNHTAASHFCMAAGETGQDLKREIEILSEDT